MYGNLAYFYFMNWLQRILLTINNCCDNRFFFTISNFLPNKTIAITHLFSTYCYSHCKVRHDEQGHHVQIVKPQQQPFGGETKAVNQYVMPVASTTNFIM